MTAAQAASAPTAVPVRRGAGLAGLHQRAQHHARFSPVTFSIGTNQRARRPDPQGATRARREFRVLSPALGADMGQSNPTSGYVRVRPQNAWLRAVNACSTKVPWTSRPGHAQPQLHDSHDTRRASPYRPLIHARQPRPGATPGSTPAVRSPHSADIGKATKSNTTRRYERPGTAGSSSHRHRRARTRGSAPAERRINRTQALRSVPATRLAAGHARPGLHPVLPSPAQREAARCHDQHKLTQRMPGR